LQEFMERAAVAYQRILAHAAQRGKGLEADALRVVQEELDAQLDELKVFVQDENQRIIYEVEMHGSRQLYLDAYGCARWTEDGLAEVASHSPIVEIGAGGGHWAAQLLLRGVAIAAFDNSRTTAPGGGGPTAALVEDGDHTILARPQYTDHALFLCYPPPTDQRAGCMATLALEQYSGDTVVFVGEGRGGANASDEFFDLLDEEWKCVKVLKLAPFSQCHEHLFVMKRCTEGRSAKE
jgi:hypothetical protein